MSLGNDSAAPLVREAAITCPKCGHREIETMPTDACQYFYDCKGCAAVLKPKPGDCCVFCSFADIKCPPIRIGDCCAPGR